MAMLQTRLSNFLIANTKSIDFGNKSTEWFIRGWEFKRGSDEWTICRLKSRIYSKKSLELCETAGKELKKWQI